MTSQFIKGVGMVRPIWQTVHYLWIKQQITLWKTVKENKSSGSQTFLRDQERFTKFHDIMKEFFMAQLNLKASVFKISLHILKIFASHYCPVVHSLRKTVL